jgi:hypothetical protein
MSARLVAWNRQDAVHARACDASDLHCFAEAPHRYLDCLTWRVYKHLVEVNL